MFVAKILPIKTAKVNVDCASILSIRVLIRIASRHKNKIAVNVTN